MKRRDLLIGLGVSPLALSGLIRSAHGEEKEHGEGKEGHGEEHAEKIVELLFVQSAEKASLKDGVLKLTGANPSTLYFSDRPERIVGHVTTKHFVAAWGEGENSFKKDNPNAVLSLLTGKDEDEIVVVLKEPRLEKKDLVYDVEVLEGGKQTIEGGPCSLFIDTIGRPLTPVSFAGHHRRVRRRTRRRVRRRH